MSWKVAKQVNFSAYENFLTARLLVANKSTLKFRPLQETSKISKTNWATRLTLHQSSSP